MEETATRDPSPTATNRRAAGGLSRTELGWLVLIAAVGVLLRWSYLHEVTGSPEFRFPTVDALFNDYWARGLASGVWTSPQIEQAYDAPLDIGKHAYFRPPGYPFFLAAIYKVFGPGYLAPRVVHMGLGLVNALLAFLLGRALFGPGTGLVSAALMSVYWILIYFEGQLLEPALLIFLSLASVSNLVMLTRRWTYSRSIAAGVLLGACALVRVNLLLFVPFALGWGWWLTRRASAVRRFGGFAAGLLAGLVIVIAPVTVRNFLVSGDFIPVSSNGGINLYIGNNRHSDGTFVASAPYLHRFVNCFEYPRIVSELEDRLGRTIRYAEVSEFYRNEALAYVVEHPGELLRRVIRKLYLFWGPHEITLNRVVQLDRESSPTLRRLPGDFSMVLALAILGAILVFRTGWRTSPAGRSRSIPPDAAHEGSIAILLFVLASCLSFLPFFVTAVYRAPVIPFLLLFAAHALWRLGRRLRERAFRPVGVGVLAGVVLYVLLRIPLIEYEPEHAKWRFDRGLAHALDRQSANAVTEYRHAIRENPHFPEAHNNLARVLARMGRFEDAIEELSRAVELDPTLPRARFGLANLLERQGRTEEAIHHYREAIRGGPDPMAYCNLGILLLGEGQSEEAADLFEKAIEIDPADIRSMNNLAWLLATSPSGEIRDGARAAELAEAVCEATGHRSARFLDTLAAAYAEAGRFSEAIGIAERALDLTAGDEGDAEAIGARLALYRRGEPYRR
jgi:tetratricopeptide (TPR) repeat protein